MIGGGMTYTFKKAMGGSIGESICEDDKLDLARSILAKAEEKGVKFLTPVDTVITKEFKNDTEYKTVPTGEIPDEWGGLDIGEETRKLFADAIKGAKTVVWNGPAGVFEVEKFAVGTKSICETLANLEGAITIIGGGDSAAAAISMGYEAKFSHISTGGGAMLNGIVEYIQAKTSIKVMYGSHASWLTQDTSDEMCMPTYSSLVGTLLLGADDRNKHPEVTTSGEGLLDIIKEKTLTIFTDQTGY